MKLLLLLFTLLLGAVWIHVCAGSFRVNIYRQHIVLLLVALTFSGMLSSQSLVADIAWRGDEDLHINYTYSLYAHLVEVFDHIPAYVLLPAILLVLAASRYMWLKNKRLFYVGLALMLGVLVVTLIYVSNMVEFKYILRYPYINRWLAVSPLLIFGPIFGAEHEIIYRIVPLLSAVMLAWVYGLYFWDKNPAVSFVATGFVVTLPIIVYYSSLLYVDLPAVVLMTVALAHADRITSLERQDLLVRPEWYALILVGFVKETTAPFLAGVLLLRLVRRFLLLFDVRAHPLEYLKELALALVVCIPLALYLFFRTTFGDVRSYASHITNLYDYSNYVALGASLWDQFGVLLFLAMGGMLLLFKLRRWWQLALCLTCFLAHALFHFLDHAGYIGYARFNLYLLPPLLVLAKEIFWLVPRMKTSFMLLLGGLTVFVNLAMSPLYMDGSRLPRWTITEAYSFPYRETLLWLKQHQTGSRIRFEGMNYPYYFEFYFRKFGWTPDYDMKIKSGRQETSEDLEPVIQRALEEGVEVLVFHASHKRNVGKYDGLLVKVSENQAHRLLVFDLTRLGEG